MEKILTISVAAYNVEKVIDRALSSLILSAEYMDKLEVIVENDGSTDRTSEIAHSYADRYPNVFRVVDKENGGYGSTINDSVWKAQGKYYRLLDADDWYINENISEYIDYLEQAESDIVLTPYYEVFMPEEKYVLMETKENAIAMHQMAIKTDILRKNKIAITEHCFYTDLEYVIQSLLYAKDISFCNKEIYCYQLGSDEQSVSLAGKKKHYKDAMRVSINVSKLIEENKDKIKHNVDGRANRLIGLAYTCLSVLDDEALGKSEMKNFDRNLKEECPYMYKVSNKIKKVKLLRMTKFLAYKTVRKQVLNL